MTVVKPLLVHDRPVSDACTVHIDSAIAPRRTGSGA
jgi:hypothetical protein